jgi:hypothetical protein
MQRERAISPFVRTKRQVKAKVEAKGHLALSPSSLAAIATSRTKTQVARLAERMQDRFACRKAAGLLPFEDVPG